MQQWKEWGYEWKFVWCGVGSHTKVPDDIQNLQAWIGYCLALIGGVCSTGDAPQSDTNFFLGYEYARKKTESTLPPAQVYYTRKKNQRGSSHDPKAGFHEFESLPDHVRAAAESMAYNARGSFEGLFPSGIALHSRNACQVLSEDLAQPRKFTVLYAPLSNKAATAVKGGTNTAYQISRVFQVPTINLFVEEERTKFVEWINRQLDKHNITPPPLEGMLHDASQ